MSTIQPRAAAAPASQQSLADRLDAINEFDREPVPPDRLQGPGSFMGLYAGEHLAGTEFVIGPLFVAHGVAALDLVLGLLVGNLLAVLSWAFITAPIATRTRLNLYWYLRKITGPNLLFVYNIVNALMFCFLAGSMISVAATAVGLPFGMAMPKLNDVYPNSVGWVLVVFLVGTAVTALAILGFEKIAAAGQVASPWMFMVFVAAAVAVLPKLGVTSLGDFWRVASERARASRLAVCTADPSAVLTVRSKHGSTRSSRTRGANRRSRRCAGTPRSRAIARASWKR